MPEPARPAGVSRSCASRSSSAARQAAPHLRAAAGGGSQFRLGKAEMCRVQRHIAEDPRDSLAEPGAEPQSSATLILGERPE